MAILRKCPGTASSEELDVPTKLPFSFCRDFGKRLTRRKRRRSAPSILQGIGEVGVMATLGAHYPTTGNSNSMAANNGTSRLSMMQARLREQLMVEKESRLLEMAARQEAARDNTIQRVTKSSASSLSSTLSSLSSSGGQGKVRKMFEERRTNGYNHSPIGWDKSYPLEPVRGVGGGGGGRPPVKPKGVIRNNRGVSMDRANAAYDPSSMKRSQSHATLQRNNNINNNNEPRSPGRSIGGLRPPQARVPNHHKSTSSLLDANQNYNGRTSSGSSGGYSRGPSRDPSPAPSSRFGFRNNLSRGPSPSPQANGSPARSGAPPPGPRRAPPASKSFDDVDRGRAPPQRRPSQPTRQAAPPRQPPQRQVRQQSRQPSFETGYEDELPTQRTPRQPPREESKPAARSRGPPITHVKSTNNNNNAPKPPPRSKPAPPKSKWSEDEEEDSDGGGQYEDELEDENSLAKSSNNKPPAKSAVPPGCVSCKICERNFAKDRIEKHETICAKSNAKSKKRKAFDPVKMRTQGTEAEKFVARGKHLEKTPKPKKADWRKKHEDFIATVRAAKGIKGYEAPPMDTSDYIQCQHCGRKFAEAVAERHIPKCASIQSNKPAAGGRRR